VATPSGLTHTVIMSGQPKISVIIPCRNMGAYLREAIESVFAQTFPVHEVIVIDDESTDNTWEVLQSFGKRIVALKGPGRGSSIARNLGILVATGDHIAFLDADDLWLPQKLEQQVRLLSDECGFVFADWYRSDNPRDPGGPRLPNYSWVTEGSVFSNLLLENFISTPTVLVRKELLGHTGLFKPTLIGSQDFDLWLRLAKHTLFAWAREPLVFMRAHAGNITSSPPYPYYQARLWQELLREHAEESAENLAYMRGRYAQSTYEAGRHAVRLLDIPMARYYFILAWKAHYDPALVAFWYLVAHLPRGVMSRLLSLKREFARRVFGGSARMS